MMSLNLLSTEEIEAIHQASLRILAETGVMLTEPRARQILYEAGARIQPNRVFLPPELVEILHSNDWETHLHSWSERVSQDPR